jgi:hypothetical protein
LNKLKEEKKALLALAERLEVRIGEDFAAHTPSPKEAPSPKATTTSAERAAAKDLGAFLATQPNMEIKAVGLSEFYRSYPWHKQSIAQAPGLKKFAAKFPKLFQWVQSADSGLNKLTLAPATLAAAASEFLAKWDGGNVDNQFGVLDIDIERVPPQEGSEAEATDASVPKGFIEVYGAGTAELNGVYTLNGSWDGRPMWSRNGFDLWYKIWGTHREWRLGKTNDYYYIFDGESEHPPKSGWELASAVQQRNPPFGASLIHPGVQLPAPRLRFLS